MEPPSRKHSPAMTVSSHGYRHTPKLSQHSDDARSEEQRGEELRRKIKQREQDLLQITLSKDRLMHNMKTNFNLSNMPDAIPTQHRKTQSIPFQSSKQQEYLSQVLSDNQSLQQRIQLVGQDLQKVQNDKQALSDKLKALRNETSHFQRYLSDNNMTESEFTHQTQELRFQNSKLAQHLQQHDRSYVLQQLSSIQQQKLDCTYQIDRMQQDLRSKQIIFNELNEQVSLNNHQISHLQSHLGEMQRHIQTHTALANEVHSINQKLMREREELVSRMHHLQNTYEFTVQELTQEQAHIRLHDKRHLQLIAAKNIVNVLSNPIRKQKQRTLAMFFGYYQFDRKCHSTLHTLCQHMFKVGQAKLQHAFLVWFKQALRPAGTRKTTAVLITKRFNTLLKYKMMKRWKARMVKTETHGEDKFIAAFKIFSLKKFDLIKEIKRAFVLWRDYSFKERVLKRIIDRVGQRQDDKRKRWALQLWFYNNMQLDAAVREHILTSTFAHEQLLTIALNQMQARSKHRKHIRYLKLAHLLKAWRDSRCYSKFMMSATIFAVKINKQSRLLLLQSMLNQIRLSKESSKYTLLLTELNQNLQSIACCEEQIASTSSKALKDFKMRKLTCLSVNVIKKLCSYFQHWKGYTSAANRRINPGLAQILLKRYLTQVHRAFDFWINGSNYRIKNRHKSNNEVLAASGAKTQCEVSKLAAVIDTEAARIQKCRRVLLIRCAKICQERLCKRGVALWAQRIAMLKQAELAAVTICDKITRQLKKGAFRLYVAKVAMLVHQQRQEQKASHLLITKTLRQKRITFNAFVKFASVFLHQRDSFGILLNKCDVWIKRRTMGIWLENGNIKKTMQLQASQNTNTELFDGLNVQLGVIVKSKLEHLSLNTELRKKLIDQGQRVLSNTFARFYYVKAERGFKKWFECVKYQQHLESLLRRTVQHQQKHRFYVTKAAFQNWIWHCKRRELQCQINKQLFMTDEAQQLIAFRLQEHQSQVAVYDAQIGEQNSLLNEASRKFRSLVSAIIRKNKDNNYSGQLRYMFRQWAQFAKRQVMFIKTIGLVVLRSQQQQGFTNIAAFARDKATTRMQNRVMQGMCRMFFKKVCGQAINRMRQNRYEGNKQQIVQIGKYKQQSDHQQFKFKTKVRQWNSCKGNQAIARHKLVNYFQAWKTVQAWIKSSKSRIQSYRQIERNFYAKQSLRKWAQRTQLTIKLRKSLVNYRQHARMLSLKLCFDGLKQQYYTDKVFCNTLAFMANKAITRQQHCAFDMIRHFVTSKQACAVQSKQVSAIDFGSLLHQMYKRKLCIYLSQLRTGSIKLKREQMTLKAILQIWKVKHLRRRFYQWRVSHTKQMCADEVNQEGPVVEGLLHEKVKFESYKMFLRDQAFTAKETTAAVEWAKTRQTELLARAVARLRHKAARNPKARMFDRWRMFAKIRKLVRHILTNIENKLQPRKADLSYIFNRWKYNKWHKLCGMDRGYLCDRSDRNQRHKHEMGELEGQAQQVLFELTNTRDELVDSLLGSQRIAISVGKSRIEKSVRKAYSTLADHTHKQRKINFSQILQERIELIKCLKDRLTEIEHDNSCLAVENEELRQFSLDGYQIAKNVKQLSADRELLSVDLADKANTIKQLLDKNDSMQYKLQQVQEYSIHLIKTQHATKVRQQAAQGRY